MTKRQKVMQALMIIEIAAIDEDGEICATHDELHIGGDKILPDSEFGKILMSLGFHFSMEGWKCFT